MAILQSLSISFNAVMPIVLLLAVGFFLRRRGVLSKAFETEANNVVYQWAMPLYMFNAARGVNLAEGLDLRLLLGGILIPFSAFLILAAVLPRFYGDNRPRIGAFICVAITSGCAIPGLALAAFLLPGDRGASFLLSVPVWVMTNVMICITAMSVFKSAEKCEGSLPQVLGRQILRTPMLWGVAAGACVNLLSVPVPGFVNAVAGYLAGLTTPLALISMGAGLHFGVFRREFKQYFTCGVLIKLILMPLVFLPLAWLAGIRGDAATALFLNTATPIGPGIYSVAVALRSDAEFLGQSMVVSQVFSCLTIFAGIAILSLLRIV